MDELGTDLRCMLASGIKIYARAVHLLTACYDIVRTKFSPLVNVTIPSNY